jgi:hypothetical protein
MPPHLEESAASQKITVTYADYLPHNLNVNMPKYTPLYNFRILPITFCQVLLPNFSTFMSDFTQHASFENTLTHSLLLSRVCGSTHAHTHIYTYTKQQESNRDPLSCYVNAMACICSSILRYFIAIPLSSKDCIKFQFYSPTPIT